MINEQLQKIKSFGCSKESVVTLEDIAAKEAELGFSLPKALQELYLIFHPEDPVFAGQMALIPFQELKIYKRVYMTDTVISILPFCRDEKFGYGFEVSRYYKRQDRLERNAPEDPQIWELCVSPETNKEKKYLYDREVPCNRAVLSQWIVEWLGYEQVRARPSVVMVNKDKTAGYWGSVRKFFTHNFYLVPKEQLSSYRINFDVLYMKDPSDILCGRIFYSDMAYFGAKTDEELEQLMKQMGFRYVWIKSRTGHPTYNSAPPQPPRERELLSIEPVLQFLREFAGIEGRGAKEESIERAEARLGESLPLPMEEFYRYLPGAFYDSYNRVRTLSGLKKTKDGKLNFLEENQAVYHWAAELGSSFLYRRSNNAASDWAPYGILDGFLAAEFLWALASDEDKGMFLWEFPDFEPEMLKEGGILEPHLSQIAGITDRIAEGNTRHIYQALGGQALGLYDSEERIFWFITKEESVMEQLEELLGFPSNDKIE